MNKQTLQYILDLEQTKYGATLMERLSLLSYGEKSRAHKDASKTDHGSAESKKRTWGEWVLHRVPDFSMAGWLHSAMEAHFEFSWLSMRVQSMPTSLY